MNDHMEELIAQLMPPSQVPRQTRVLGMVLGKGSAVEASAFLCAAIANMIGNIPQEKWQEMLKFEFPACSTPGCECHVVQQKLMQALVPVRQIFEKACDKRSGTKGFSE